MAFFEYPYFSFTSIPILLLPLYFFLKNLKSKSHVIPTNWPIFGMTPALIQNVHRIHDYASDILIECGGTFLLRGPWFTNMDMLITGDPANVNHMLCKNFSNYQKGPDFKKMFDILGDGIFNSDFELWEIHRKTTKSLFNHPNFCSLLETNVWSNVEQGLLPVLESMSEKGMMIDLQDIFQRFTLDGICKLIFDHDPKSLTIDLPYIPFEKGFSDAESAVLYRHIFPEKVWKLQSFLQIGEEKKLSRASKAFDQFIYKCISLKQGEQQISSKKESTNVHDLNFVTAFMRAYDDIKSRTSSTDPKQFLRDTLLNLVFAGRDTTSIALTWFFFLLAKHPSVEQKIRQEIINTKLIESKNTKFGVEDVNKMVYLHGSLCESLRLYPPVPFERKTPSQPDILPSGHAIDKNTKIIISLYSMGRMESIWGKDCLEFKPERWISEQGGIKQEPLYKFAVFHAGPRTCLGKEMAFIQMKIVATSIIWNYHVEVVEGYPVSPSDSVVLQVKDGMKVRLTKRGEKVL